METPRGYASEFLELFAVDPDISSDHADRPIVFRGGEIHAHFIPGLEGRLGPALVGLGDGIPHFDHPVRDGATGVLDIHLY
jgi:hypothetical protein